MKATRGRKEARFSEPLEATGQAPQRQKPPKVRPSPPHPGRAGTEDQHGAGGSCGPLQTPIGGSLLTTSRTQTLFLKYTDSIQNAFYGTVSVHFYQFMLCSESRAQPHECESKGPHFCGPGALSCRGEAGRGWPAAKKEEVGTAWLCKDPSPTCREPGGPALGTRGRLRGAGRGTWVRTRGGGGTPAGGTSLSSARSSGALLESASESSPAPSAGIHTDDQLGRQHGAQALVSVVTRARAHRSPDPRLTRRSWVDPKAIALGISRVPPSAA